MEPFTAQCGKMQAVTILCRLQCDWQPGGGGIRSTECCWSIVNCLSSSLRYRLVGATSSEGFPVNWCSPYVIIQTLCPSKMIQASKNWWMCINYLWTQFWCLIIVWLTSYMTVADTVLICNWTRCNVCHIRIQPIFFNSEMSAMRAIKVEFSSELWERMANNNSR